MPCRESINSRRVATDGSIERVYIVEGTTDEVQAAGEAFAESPATYRGRFRNPMPDIKPTGRAIFEITFNYELLSDDSQQNDDTEEPKGEDPTLATLEIDGAGGTEHVTQCIKQTAYPNGKGTDIVARRIVGAHKDGVHGVDIDVGGSVINLTCKWLPEAITGDYVKALLDLRGFTNSVPYTVKWGYRGRKYQIEFPAGELRFLAAKIGTTLTRKGVGVFEIGYSILHSKNRTNISLSSGSGDSANQNAAQQAANITIPSKKGHEYIWVWHKKETLTNPALTIETPDMAFVSQLYEETDFKDVLKF